MKTQKAKKIVGFNLEATLEDGVLVIIDVTGDEPVEIYRTDNPGVRIRSQFLKGRSVGQTSTGKMASILECLKDEPEMEPYL